jgi:hypothetical protein
MRPLEIACVVVVLLALVAFLVLIALGAGGGVLNQG